MVYFQGHASPGVYARAYSNGASMPPSFTIFARNCLQVGGLSSYPHPYLMPDFWQFPTVSMGLAPIMSIYQARFNRYLKSRGLAQCGRTAGFGASSATAKWMSLNRSGALYPGGAGKSGQSRLGSQLQLAASRWPGKRQWQDHSGAGIDFSRRRMECHQSHLGLGLGSAAAADENGLLVKRMEEAVDGDYQKYSVEPGSYTRKHFFGKYPELAGDGQSFDR